MSNIETTNIDPLKMEFGQLNDYARHSFQILISWYTLFIAANIVAAGWFMSLDDLVKAPRLFAIVIASVFFIGNILSIIVASLGRKYFKRLHQRAIKIAEILNKAFDLDDTGMKSPIPYQIYAGIIIIIKIVFIAIACSWLIFTLYMIFNR